jgi:predicted RNase H-like HicB family nuclease
MSEQIQVRPGMWRTRDGRDVCVRVNGAQDTPSWPWCGVVGGLYEMWRDDGTWLPTGEEDKRDLVQYLRPLPEAEAPAPAVEPEPQPVEIRDGVWRTRDGRQMQVRKNTDCQLPSHPWVAEFDGEQYIWMRDGRFHAEADSPADLVAYLRPLPKAETTTETLAEIEQQAAEDLQQWMEATALQRRRLEAELSAVTAERDRLQQAHQTMTEHARELLESAQQARDQRDLLAQKLVTKPSEEALQKQNAKQQIEINTLQDQLETMTTDRETLWRQFAAMTADRDRLATEVANAQRLASDLRSEVDFVRTQKTAQEHELRGQIDRLQRELRDARIEIDAAAQDPGEAAKDAAHEQGFDRGQAWAFSAVHSWVRPLVGASPDDAAGLLQALPGCIRRLAEREGVTL